MKSKTVNRLAASILAATLLFMTAANAVHVEETDKNVRITITTDKQQYAAADVASVTVQVENRTDRVLGGVVIAARADHWLLVRGSVPNILEVGDMQKGETRTLSFRCVLDHRAPGVRFLNRIFLLFRQILNRPHAFKTAGYPDERIAEVSETVVHGGADVTITAAVAATVGTTAHDYGEGADYAYAYAGIMPKQANMDVEWNLLLVNRNYILPQDYSPDLSEAVKGSGVYLDSRVSPHYQEMYDAAKKDGVKLTPLSGHRRISTQKTNFENKIRYFIELGYDRAEATRQAARIILPPGTSEHNAGLAMDIISLDVDFEETKAFAWLQAHAQDYGFILRYPKDKESITEITYEPWHWRYVGVPAAKAIKQSGQTLEEYLNAV